MEQEDPSPYDAPGPDQLPSQIGTQAFASQPQFLHSLEESQEARQDGADEYSLPEQYHPAQSPVLQPSSSRFIRRAIETTEQIAAGLQLQRPPPARNVVRSSNGEQSNQSLHSVPNVQSIYQSRSNFNTPSPAAPGRQHDALQPTVPGDNVGESSIESGGNDTPAVAAEPHETSKEAFHANRSPEDVDEPSVHSAPKTSDYPFPDEVESSPPHKRKNKHYNNSPFAKDPLPKSYAQIQHRALAEQSSRSRASIARSLASPAKTKCLASRSTRGNNSIERCQPSGGSQSSETVGRAPAELHTDVDLITKKHLAKQQRIKSLMRPIPAQRLADEAATTTRPNSQSSNISKHRTRPSNRRQGGTPTREQNNINLMKFAESWNANNTYNQQLLDRWEQKMAMLEKHIENQDSTIDQCYKEIETRDETINTLSMEIEEQRTQAQTVQDEIATATAARKKLEDKLKSCRSRLNDAINEQQQLFLRCRERFQETTAYVKEEGQIHKDTLEETAATVELVRADIKQEVAALINGVNSQVGELHTTINSLELQLVQSEQDLEHQRGDAASLREQLADSYKLNEQSLQLIAAQNRELLERLSQDRQTADERDSHIKKQGQKIDTILTALEGVKSMAIDQVALTEDIKAAHGNTVNTIVAEIQSSAQSAGGAAVHDRKVLNDNLDQIRIICNGISDGVAGVSSGAHWQTIAHENESTIRDQALQMQGLQHELQQARALLDKKSEEQAELQKSLDILQVNSENEELAMTKVKDLTAQVQQLQTSLSDKDAAIAESKNDLAAIQDELRTELRKFRDKEKEILDERQAYTRTIGQKIRDMEKKDYIERQAYTKTMRKRMREQDEAALLRVSRETERIKEDYTRKERQLQEDMSKEREQLEQELAKLREAAETKDGAVLDEELRRIKGELAAARTSVTRVAANLDESEQQRQALLKRCEQWSHDRHMLAQMNDRLDRIAKDQPDAIQLHRSLKELLELQRNLSSDVEYYEARLSSAEAATADSNPTNNPQNGDDQLTLESQSLKRKVMVRSPAEEVHRASLLSIEDERKTRRQTIPSRSIIKLPTPNASGESQATDSGAAIGTQMPGEPQPTPKRKVVKRGLPLNTHSLYNRPVAGSVTGTSQEHEDASRAGSRTHTSDATPKRGTPSDEISDGRFNSFGHLQDPEGRAVKRQRTSEVIQQPTQVSRTPMTKLIHSMAGYFLSPKPRDQETAPAPKTTSSRGGPLERRPSTLVTYGQSSLKRGRSSSQSSFGSSQAVEGDQIPPQDATQG
ncbi:hypothetical protein GGR53DRAFT_369032 [Hypoxylon sp. FL1150]|nr:hypothetical protein GGR53DRAFT_369032 [Hypoxylon sp. FL1150]